MKLLSISSAAMLAAQTVQAAPLNEDTGLVEYRSVNKAHAALATLEKRLNCQFLDRPIRAIGTSKITVVYIVATGGLARSVCALVGYPNCGDLVAVIQGALALVYYAAAHYSGAEPDTSGIPTARDIHSASLDLWKDVTATEGLSYDSIARLPFDVDHETLHRRDGDPALLTRTQLTGLVSNATGHKQDIIINEYEDGNIVLHLPVGDISNGDLSKRVDRPGFKISFTTREKSKLTRAHQDEMATYGAQMWADYADIRSDKMDDFIGFAETGHKANFYYRIIPEQKGFGLNYESVDICGGMADYL